MKLQKQLSRRVGKKEYAKYVVVIPPKIIKKTKLKDGQELEVILRNKEIIIRKK